MFSKINLAAENAKLVSKCSQLETENQALRVGSDELENDLSKAIERGLAIEELMNADCTSKLLAMGFILGVSLETPGWNCKLTLEERFEFLTKRLYEFIDHHARIPREIHCKDQAVKMLSEDVKRIESCLQKLEFVELENAELKEQFADIMTTVDNSVLSIGTKLGLDNLEFGFKLRDKFSAIEQAVEDLNHQNKCAAQLDSIRDNVTFA